MNPFELVDDALRVNGHGRAPLAMTPLQALTVQFELPEPDAVDAAGGATPETPPGNASAASPGASAIELRQGLVIGDLRLMIRYQDGSELADVPRVHRLPNAPAWFHGMTNLHGTLTPVFGLAEYLGMSEHSGLANPDRSARMMLVMGTGADAAAVLIDQLPRRLRFESHQRLDDAPVPAALKAHVSGTYWIDEQAWMDFKPADLFNQLEAELKPAH